MRTICLFVHYSEEIYFPEYIMKYVHELALHFQEVKLLSNPGKISSHPWPSNVELVYQPNRGYDFGRIYTYLQFVDLQKYDFLAVVNDSNWLVHSLEEVLDWSVISQYDLWGMIDSHEKPWFSKHRNNYHIQSHFMVLGRNAIRQLDSFFQKAGVHEIMEESDPKILRRLVINRWEIGLSQFMISSGLTIGSFINSREFNQQHGVKETANTTHVLYEELIESGYPLLKRKAIFQSSKTVHLQPHHDYFEDIPSGTVDPKILFHSNVKRDSVPSHHKPLIIRHRLIAIYRFGKNALGRFSFRLAFLND